MQVLRPPPPLASPLPGSRAFDLGGTVVHWAGSGPPLLLVHSVNAAASAAEMRPLFDHYRATRTVFAPDLPGYGASARPDVDHTPRSMTDALHRVAAAVRQRSGAPGGLDALALSLGCEFLARAAAERPAQFARLALVSPTGFRGGRTLRGAPGSTRAVPAMRALLRRRPWSAALFRGLTRPAVVRYFLQRTFGGPRIDEAMWAHAMATAAQPGARHAPLDFLTGALFSADIHTVYESLRQPVWVAHGTRGDFTDYRQLRLVADRPNWRVSVQQGGALPYAAGPDALAAFVAECDRWLATPATATAAPPSPPPVP